MMAAGKKNAGRKSTGIPEKSSSMRKGTEKKPGESPESSPGQEGQTREHLVHELQVHQIELETQAEELRRTHAELEESRDKYLDLYEFAPVGYITLTDTESVSEVNITGAKLLGVSRNKLQKVQFRKFVVPEDSDQWARYFVKMADTGKKQTCTLRLRRGDGSAFHAHLEGIRITESSNGATTVKLTISDITEIGVVEAALAEREEQFRSVVQNSSDLTILTDPKGSVTYVSPQCEQVLGYSPTELIGKIIPDIIHPDDVARCREEWEKVAWQGLKIQDYEYRIIDSRGLVRWISHSASRTTVNGRILGIQSAIRDITGRKNAEEKVRESETKYKEVIENANEAIVVVQDEKIEYANPRAVDVIQATPEEIASHPFVNFIHPDDRELVFDRYQRRLKGEDIQENYDFRLLSPSGHPVWVQISAVRIAWNGRPATLNFLTDITRRKTAEEHLQRTLNELEERVRQRTADLYAINMKLQKEIEDRKVLASALQESEGKFRRIFETLDDIYYRADMTGKIIDISPSSKRLLGWNQDELIGTPIENLYQDPSERQVFLSDLQKTGWVYDYEVTMKNRDGHPVPLSVNVHIIFDAEGYPAAIEGTFRDITERKQAEDARQRQAATLVILNEVITTANMAETLDEATEKIVEDILRLLDYDAGGIYLVDPGNTTATIIYSKNLPPAFLENVKTLSIEETPYNILFTEGLPLISSHYDEVDPHRSQLSGFLSLATVPIISKGTVIGSLNFASRKRNEIPSEDKDILLTIGHELGSTIERLKAFRESENAASNLMTLFNSVNEMVFVLDMQGRIITANQAVKIRLLYSEEELAGMDVLCLHVPGLRDEALQNVQGMIAGTIDSCPVPVLAKDGTRIEVETKVTRGTWNNQEVLIGVSRDITERKQAEEALKKSEELLTLAITGSGAGLWDWNAQTGETQLNVRSAEIVGYSLEELKPLSINTVRTLTHPDDIPKSDELIRLHFEGELPEYECELRLKHKDGRWVWVLVRGKVTQRDSGGKPLRMTGTYLDISRRKALEMEIEFHEQELMQHSARLSHEIGERRRIEDEIRIINQQLENRVRERTDELAETVRKLQDENEERKRMEELIRRTNRKLALMNDVSYQDIQNKITLLRGFVSIGQKADSEEVRQEYYKKQENALKNIHNLIKNTRDYQKLGVEKYQWVDMEKAVHGARVPPDSGISLTADLHGLFIYSDPQVSGVFDFLIDNAVKHGKKITLISVSWNETPEGATITCEDDGVGIPAVEKARIFERVVAGEGKFGLFYVKELLTMSGMTIQEAGEPGKGARFEIRVPAGMYRNTP
jgi:PAS domain S-box-containing protein